MHRHLGPVAALFVALVWTDLPAQQACTLLTPADIETTTGAKALEPHPTTMVIPEGPQKGQPMNGCMWGIADKGMVALSVMEAPPPGPAREAGLAKIREVMDQLKAKKWTEEQKKFPDGSCSIMTPPPTDKSAPILSGCIVVKRGMVVSSNFMSPTKKLTIDQVRALTDKTPRPHALTERLSVITPPA